LYWIEIYHIDYQLYMKTNERKIERKFGIQHRSNPGFPFSGLLLRLRLIAMTGCVHHPRDCGSSPQ